MKRFIMKLEWQAWFLLICALLAMLYVQLFFPFEHQGGDIDAHFSTARAILRIPGTAPNPLYGPGMAIFLILSGVIGFDTWRIMIIIYALMSAALPCIIYCMLRPYHKVWALISGLIIIVGMIPYAYSRIDSYALLFLFFEFLSFFVIALYFKNQQKYKKFPYLIAFLLFALNTINPISIILFWIFFFVAFFFKKNETKILLKSVMFYIALMAGWIVFDKVILNNTRFPLYGKPVNSMQQRFAEVYYRPSSIFLEKRLQGPPVISESDGSASKQLIETVRQFTFENVTYWIKTKQTPPYTLYGQYLVQPESLVQALFRDPNAFYFNFIRAALQSKLGAKADDLMYSVAKEHYNTGLLAVVKWFLNEPMKLITGPVVSLGWRNFLGVYSYMPIRKIINGGWEVLVDLNNLPTMDPELGPFSKEYFSILHLFIYDFPQLQKINSPSSYWQLSNDVLARYAGRPETLMLDIRNSANLTPRDFSFIETWYYMLFMSIYGFDLTDQLFAHVAGEMIKNYPMSLLLFVDNFLKESLGFRKFNIKKTMNYDQLVKESEINYLDGVRTNITEDINQKLASELPSFYIENVHSRLIAFLYRIIHLAAPFFLIIALVLLRYALAGATCPLAIFFILVYFYFVSIFSVFGNFGAQRYSDIFILIPLMIIVLGISGYRSIKNSRNNN